MVLPWGSLSMLQSDVGWGCRHLKAGLRWASELVHPCCGEGGVTFYDLSLEIIEYHSAIPLVKSQSLSRVKRERT